MRIVSYGTLMLLPWCSVVVHHCHSLGGCWDVDIHHLRPRTGTYAALDGEVRSVKWSALDGPVSLATLVDNRRFVVVGSAADDV